MTLTHTRAWTRTEVSSNTSFAWVTYTTSGKHALGDRARKLDQGILITRFELPFNIWWYVIAWAISCALSISRSSVEHATTTSAWACDIMQRRRKLECTTAHRSILSGVNVIYATGGLRSRQTLRWVCAVVLWPGWWLMAITEYSLRCYVRSQTETGGLGSRREWRFCCSQCVNHCMSSFKL